MHTRVVTRTSPGIRIIHQQPESSTFWDMDMRLPQDTVVRGSPSPRKLKVDSVSMACPMLVTTMNMMEEIKLGTRWRSSSYQNGASMVLAARI